MLLRNAILAGAETDQPYGLIDRGAVVLDGERITWVGRENDLPKSLLPDEALDLGGRLVTPGLID